MCYVCRKDIGEGIIICESMLYHVDNVTPCLQPAQIIFSAIQNLTATSVNIFAPSPAHVESARNVIFTNLTRRTWLSARRLRQRG